MTKEWLQETVLKNENWPVRPNDRTDPKLQNASEIRTKTGQNHPNSSGKHVVYCIDCFITKQN